MLDNAPGRSVVLLEHPTEHAMGIFWDQERMSTGIAEIDAQHQEMIRRFNELEAAVMHAEGQVLVPRMLDFLDRYTRFHFAREEECMVAYGCTAAAANRAAHEELRADLATIRSQFDRKGVASVDVIHLERALGNWIRNHICSIDARLRQCVLGGERPKKSVDSNARRAERGP